MASDLKARQERLITKWKMRPSVLSSIAVSENTFDDLIVRNPIVFIDFWASWCGPCRIMEPIVEKLATKYSGKVLFGKVNVDEEMNISSRYEVFSIPTFMVFKNGQPMDAVIGAVGEASLERLVKNAVEGSSAET